LHAIAAPSRRARSLARAICGWTRPPRPQSVLAMTVSWIAHFYMVSWKQLVIRRINETKQYQTPY
jgi:hypothetical protein